jgi:hypothetical protein
MPFEQPPPQPPETVLIMSGEDDLQDTIKPRLRAAGAEQSRIATVALRKDKHGHVKPFSVPEDVPTLERALGYTEATFVVIDPIAAFLSEQIHSHNDSSVRKAMTPLTMLAQRSGSAFLLLRHLNKDATQTKALYRGGGSIAFAGSARSVLLTAEKPESEGVVVLAQTKGNLARRGLAKSLEWRVVSWDDDPDIAKVKWLGASELGADDLLKRFDARRDDYAQREAIDFLQKELAAGPRESDALLKAARRAGITPTTLKRARAKLDVHAYRARNTDGTTDAWYAHLRERPLPEVCGRCRRVG